MLRLTLSTAVAAPYVLLTPSMRICALALGSSQGRSARGFVCVAITSDPWSARRSVVRWRRGAAPCRGEERALDRARPHHATLPPQFAVEIDTGPEQRAGGAVG